nr:NAD(P)-dependent oxidoreductase [Arthrobacter sp. ISL-5]
MKVLVTGARGKVGTAAVRALTAAGHDVTGSDLGRHDFDRILPGEPEYQQADLTDAGQAYAIVRGFDAVVHAAAIRSQPATLRTLSSKTTSWALST